MKILIVGAGGVGGYIAAYLAKSDNDVTVAARGEHGQKIKSDGISIIENNDVWNIHVNNVTTFDGLEGTYDVVLLCIKSYDMAEVVNKVRLHVNRDTIIIPFANGVEHAENIQSEIDAKVLSGCVYILSHIKEPGVIEKKGKVFTAVFGSVEFSDETECVKELFESASLRVKTPEDIREAIWKKYIFISAFASLTTYYDMSIKKIYENHFSEAKQLLQEIAAVADAKGVDISNEVEKSLNVASSLPQDASTSMHLDVSKKRRCELETLSGYIVKEGSALNVATPVMKKIYDELKERV